MIDSTNTDKAFNKIYPFMIKKNLIEYRGYIPQHNKLMNEKPIANIILIGKKLEFVGSDKNTHSHNCYSI